MEDDALEAVPARIDDVASTAAVYLIDVHRHAHKGGVVDERLVGAARVEGEPQAAGTVGVHDAGIGPDDVPIGQAAIGTALHDVATIAGAVADDEDIAA